MTTDRIAVEYDARVVRLGSESYELRRADNGWSVIDGFGGRTIGVAILRDGRITFSGENAARAERVVHAWLEYCGAQKLDAWPPALGGQTRARAEVPTDDVPMHAVRDLLGLVRAMYRAAKDSGASAAELAKHQRVGRDLKRALELARNAAPGTPELAEASALAERGAIAVADLVSVIDNAEPIVRAAQRAVEGRRRR